MPGQVRKERGHPDEIERPAWLEPVRVDVRNGPVDPEFPGHEINRLRLYFGSPDLRGGYAQCEKSKQSPVTASKVENMAVRRALAEDQPQYLLGSVMLLQ